MTAPHRADGGLGHAPLFSPESGKVVVVREALLRATDAASLSDGAKSTLWVLYRYAFKSAETQDNWAPDGAVRIWPPMAQLARERRLTERSLMRHVIELETAGLLRRERHQGAKDGDVWLFSQQIAIERLLARDDVQLRLREMFPNDYDDKIVSCEPLASSGLEDDEFYQWLRGQRFFMGLDPKKGTLAAVLKSQQTQTLAVREAREAKPPSQRMGGGVTRPRLVPKEFTGPSLLAHLRDRVKANLSPLQPKNTLANAAIMAQLLKQMGGDGMAVLAYIDGITEPATWAAAKEKFTITTSIPTPPMLLGFMESLVAYVTEGGPTALRRSGGAAVVETTVNPFSPDDYI